MADGKWKIGDLLVEFWCDGAPRWTRFHGRDGVFAGALREEEVRDLHYRLGRIIAQIDEAEAIQLARRLRHEGK